MSLSSPESTHAHSHAGTALSRRRYVYREVEPGRVECLEVGQDWTDARRSTGDLGKFQYDGLRAPDGTDVSSREKHRRYMRENGLTLASDCTETWAKANSERERARDPRAPKPESYRRELREHLKESYHRLRKP